MFSIHIRGTWHNFIGLMIVGVSGGGEHSRNMAGGTTVLKTVEGGGG